MQQDARRPLILDRPHRIVLYGLDGMYERDFRVPSTVHAPRMLEVDDAGDLYLKAIEGEVRPGLEEPALVLVHISQQGEVMGRVPLPREDPSGKGFMLITPEGPQGYFTVATHHAWSRRGYLVVGRSDRYALHRVGDETASMEFQKHVEPAPVGREERDEWHAWAQYFQDGRGLPESHSPVPELKPLFKGLWIDDDGRI